MKYISQWMTQGDLEKKNSTPSTHNVQPSQFSSLNAELKEWPRQNFSLHYQYNIKQTSDENKEKYQ